MARKNKKLQKNQIRNIIIILIIAICLFIIYKFNFTTKSEVEITTPVTFKEFGTETTLNSNIPLKQNEDGEYYIVLPEKVNGVYVTKYFINSSEDTTKNQTSEANTIQNENANQNTINTENKELTENTQTNTVDESNNTNNVATNTEAANTTNTITNTVTTNNITTNTATNNSEIEENETQNEEQNQDTDQEIMSLFDSAVKTYSSNLENQNTETSSINENTVENTVIEENNENSESQENANKIEENNNQEENNTQEENKIENNKQNSNESNSEKSIVTTSLPGERYYISKEDVENGTASIEVEFQTIEINGTKLYNQELTSDMVDAQINLVCYIPLGYYLDVKKEDTDSIQELKSDVEEIAKSTTLFAYDITITDGTNEYQPQDYNQVAKVTITTDEELAEGESSSSLEVLHIVEDEEKNEINFQKITISNKDDNSLEFATNEFSIYAVILYDSIQPTYVTVDNYDKEKYYYLGKNYTDDISGENSNTYKEEDLVKVNVEYYGYDYTDTLSSNTPITLSGSNVNLATENENSELISNVTNYYYDVIVTTNANSKKDIDSNKNWTMTFNVGNSFSLANTKQSSANTGKFSNVSYQDGKLTISGENFSSWTCIDLKTYVYKFRIYFTDSANKSISNAQITAIQRHLVGYVGPEKKADGTAITYSDGDSGERQQLFKYVLCLPKDSSGNISFEAIDNPFIDRPAGYGFNGWLNKENVNISTDSSTFVQTISTNTNGAKEITIKLYVDWKEANEVFINTNATSNGTGTINSPTNTFANASTVLKNNYKTTTTVSNRELNIITLIGGTIKDITYIASTVESTTTYYPYTLTSLYNGTDYRISGTNNSVNASLNLESNSTSLNADLQLYYLNITGSSEYTTNNSGTGNISKYIKCNSYNVRIGRGMTPLDTSTSTTTFTQVQGGGITGKRYKLVVESGKYNNIQAWSPNTTSGYTTNSILVIGNDYDREKNNNSNLKVYSRISSRTGSGTMTPVDSTKPLYYINVKSGNIGLDYFVTKGSNYYYAGIYVGGHGSASDDRGNRILKVEGGEIANIIGGLAITSTYSSTVKTYIYMTGGTVENIVGGAGRTGTYGNRTIQVTGGNVKYCVFGGSNGVLLTGTDTGEMYGSSLVYIGGNAQIGIENDSTSELYGAVNGSVFGAGNGNSTNTNAGRVYSSRVIVNDNAQIKNSVYGGGNYGIVNPVSTVTVDDTSDVIEFVDKSTSIESNGKYIIANSASGPNAIVSNAAGTGVANSTISTKSIPSDNQYWILEKNGNQYALKNATTNKYLKITPSTNRNKLNGGSISFTTTPETYFTYTVSTHRLSTTVTWTYNSTSYSGSLYLGYPSNSWTASTDSSVTVYFLNYNEVEAKAPDTEIADNVEVKIDILGGEISNNVYGGSNRSNITGSVKIKMTDGLVEGTVYGGSNIQGNISGYSFIYVYGGTIGKLETQTTEDAIFGGGKGEKVNGSISNTVQKNTSVVITDKENDVKIYGNIYGGSAWGTVSGNSKVYISDSKSDKNTITISNYIFGGGKGSIASESNVAALTGGDVSVTIDGGDYSTATVFGGCNAQGVISGSVLIKIGENYKTVLNEVYGAGNQSDLDSETDSDYVYLYKNTTVNNAFNGGMHAGVNGNNIDHPRAIYAIGATILDSLYGGSNLDGAMQTTYVYCMDGANIGNVYGGGYGSGAKITYNTNVFITSKDENNKTTITGNVFGGGNSASINQNTNLEITSSIVKGNVYGGGNVAEVKQNTFTKITDSEIGSLYGGGNKGKITNGYASVTISNSKIGTIYGGGSQAATGESNTSQTDDGGYKTNIYLEKSEVTQNIFGGGEGSKATVAGNTNVELVNSKVSGNIFGGGDAGNITGSASITLTSSNVAETIYGGGNEASIGTNTSIILASASNAKEVFGGGNDGSVESNTSVYVTEKSIVSDNVYGGGCKGNVTGNTIVTISDATVSNNVYGGGESANVNGTLVSMVSNSKAENVYGGGDQGEVTENTRVIIDNSEAVNVYGGGRGATYYTNIRPGKVGTYASTIIRNSSKITESVFGGGQGITAIIGEDTSVALTNSEIGIDIYGGGDNGFVTGNTSVAITSATINGSAYGAGNGTPAVVKGKSYIYVEGTTKIENNLFGGGNAAPTGETETNINNDLVSKNKLSARKADSVVDIAGAQIGGNVYGGANSSVIYGDVAINIGIDAINNYYANISGETEKNYKVGKIYIKDTIYGGGEQMDPTKEFSFKTVSVEGYININIDGNGYDNGENTIFIGENVFGSGHASRAGLDKSILQSAGIVAYDDDDLIEAISDDDTKYNNYVTLNGDVVIKNYGSTQTSSSGTVEKTKSATSLQRCGNVTLDKVNLALSGTTDSTNVHATVDFSLNQIGLLNIKNGTTLYLRHGANLLESFSSTYDDKNGDEQYVTVAITNEITDTDGNVYTYDGEYATRSGVKYIVQSGIIYTISNGGLDEKVSEVDSIKTKSVNADADNRIYMYSGINLDISSDENLDTDKFGPVKGMTFFGIYKASDDENSEYDKGMFDRDYNVGSTINWDERNYTHCYAQGLHEKSPEQDITKDGFYTNFEQFGVELGLEDEITSSNYDTLNATSYTNYITPTPDEANYYMWYAGPDSDTYYFPITLVASKYSTHGAYTLELREINFENSTFVINEVESDLADGVVLCDKNTIPNVNPNTDEADTKFGLTMTTGTNAWSMNGSTEFYADSSLGGDTYSGTRIYKTENSKNTPSLSFYLTHSNNISENAKSNLGYYTITMNLTYYKDALSKAQAKVIIEVALKSKYYDDIGYDAAITPGRQYDVFSKSTTNITTKSCFSTYFELAVADFKGENSVIRDFYTPGEDDTASASYNAEAKLNEFFATNYREITSDYVFPENTTITMIDKSDSDNPEYYYYQVTANDVSSSKKTFRLNEFLKMGSSNEYYNDDIRSSYYNSSGGLDYEYECFLFIIDFESANFTNSASKQQIATDQTISMSLKSDVTNYEGNKFQITLLDEYINSKAISFGIYNTSSKIEIDATLSQNKIYLGTPTDIEITTKYKVESPDENKNITIHDTRYFDKKQGIKLTIYDSNGDIVKGASLLGTYFEITDQDGNVEKYYPRTDGTTRIKVAEKVSNSKSSITIKTENSSLQSGKYTILLESFASADGVYFGIESSDSDTVTLDIVDNSVGLNSSLPSEQVIIDKDTGYTLDESTGYISNENNKLNINLEYSSGLTDPYIAVSLYRRDYNNPYDRTYNYVDLSDYVQETLEEVPEELQDAYAYETTEEDDSSGKVSTNTKNAGYTAFSTKDILAAAPDETVSANLKLNYTLKNNLTTGTYKIVFKLYDINKKTVYEEVENGSGGTTSVPKEVTEYQYIGDTYSYIIIK